jgi:hypothetical protein
MAAAMKGHVKQRGGRFYAVIYAGLDPVTGREIRRWHPAGTDRGAAERLAAKLAKAETGRSDATRSLTFGAYLVDDWLPTKKLRLAATTHAGYERNVQRHVLPALGHIRLRRLTHNQINALYDRLLAPTAAGPALAPKTVYEIHLVIRGGADRRAAPRARDKERRPGSAVTDDRRRPTAGGPVLDRRRATPVPSGGQRPPLLPASRLTAMTGMRRSEVLGLKDSRG